jgi:precorrin-3B synthase
MTAIRPRGACPALAAPMATGDGLLARLIPASAIVLDAFVGLCAAARAHGNGIVEVTARGSLQIRGLTPASTPLFVEAIDALAIDADADVPIAVNPLTGRDPQEFLNASALASALRAALAVQPLRLAPKVSVVIDGGGALHLDALAADLRLRADENVWHVGLGATALGAVAPSRAAETALRLLATLAGYGPMARVRDVIAAHETDAFKNSIADCLVDAPALPVRRPAEPVGIHVLREDQTAIGVALAFGHSDADTLTRLIEAARDAAADSVRVAPGRALLILGIAPDAVTRLTAAADRLGFIVDPRDPRRRVVACAGAPICSAGEIPARLLAPQIAAAVGERYDSVHVSGCAKGCAHHGPAALTIIGRDGQCDLMIGGVAAGRVALDQLLDEIARLAAPKATAHG